jgi:alcohol dehydrogenase (cytochrome c)
MTHMTLTRCLRVVVFSVLVGAASLAGQEGPPVVTQQDLSDGLKDPTRWLMFGGDYGGRRHSPLSQLTPQNVNRLQPQWIFQTEQLGRFETTSLLLDGVLYVTGPNNNAWALDARTGRQIWRYRRELPATGLTACCGLVNKGFGALGDKLFMSTLDAHLLALDMRTGKIVWDVTMEDYKVGFASTIAPLVVKDKVIVGVAGGEFGVRCSIAAYDAQTGKTVWKLHTVPAAGEPGDDTWTGDTWERGGASVWTTGTFDPELNLLYYGTGNPGPDFYGDDRKGDNLYSDTLLALDVDTGKPRWHYQFTPHDVHDWDATQVPVLGELTIGGQPRKVVMVANRNGFFYTLDRTNGKLLVARPYVATSWAQEVGADGRPILRDGHTPNEQGETTCPDITGGTNFNPPSFDPALRLFFVNAREVCATYFGWQSEHKPGQVYTGGSSARPQGQERPFGAVRAIDPTTGERRWEFRYANPTLAGVLSTASGLVFSGDDAGNVLALEARTGKLLWGFQLGSALWGTSPTTYLLDGRQFVLVPAGGSLIAFALPKDFRSPR